MTTPPDAAINCSPSFRGRCTGSSGLRAKWSVMTGIIQRRVRSARTSPQGTKIGAWPKRKMRITESSRPIVLATMLMQPL